MKKPRCSECDEKTDELWDAEGCQTYDAEEGLCKSCACAQIEMRIEDLQGEIDALQKRKDRLE